MSAQETPGEPLTVNNRLSAGQLHWVTLVAYSGFVAASGIARIIDVHSGFRAELIEAGSYRTFGGTIPHTVRQPGHCQISRIDHHLKVILSGCTIHWHGPLVRPPAMPRAGTDLAQQGGSDWPGPLPHGGLDESQI